MAKRLVILSGPSCVGKGPVVAAVKKFKIEIEHEEIPVIKSRESRNNIPRPDDEKVWKNKDYWRTAEEIMTKFSISQKDLANQLATLRHCELLKGHKEGGRVYIVPFR